MILVIKESTGRYALAVEKFKKTQCLSGKEATGQNCSRNQNITYWNVIDSILTPPFITIPAEGTGLYNLHHTAYDSFGNI